MEVELKEEELLAHYILNVLTENNKTDLFKAFLSLLNSEQQYIQILPNRGSIVWYNAP